MTHGRASILLVASNFPPVLGGSASVYASMARHAAGEVVVLSSYRSYVNGLKLIGWREHDRAAPFDVIRAGLLRTILRSSSGGWFRRAGFLLSDLAIRTRVAAIILHLIAFRGIRSVCIGELIASAWIIRLCALLPGIRVVAYVHGEEITTSDPYDPDHAHARRGLVRADRIIVVSSFTERAVIALMGQDSADRITRIENGVDTARFRIAPRDTALQRMHGTEGCFVFVSVCRMIEKKGIDHALIAFAAFHREHKHSRYLVVGSGPDLDRLRRIAAEHRVADAVVFVGYIEESMLADYYRMGDVFVMPNRRMPDGDTEGFGLVFLEANSCGLPVIAGQDGGSVDAVSDGVNGLVVDGHSIEAIHQAMLRLHGDTALYRRIAEAGRRVATDSSWEHKAARFLAACRA